MLTNKERVCLIRKRTAEIKCARAKKIQSICDAACVVCAVLLICGIGNFMPNIIPTATVEINHSSGVASLLSNNSAVGYILMGIMSFLLGVCITILLYRLHNRTQAVKDKEDSDEF